MDEHYFTADPSVAFKRAPVHATVWGHELDLVSGSGVFAQGRVDIGTAILFRETEPPAPGRILDLGCGYGADRARRRRRRAGGGRHGRRRQRARGAAGERERRRRSGWPTGSGR